VNEFLDKYPVINDPLIKLSEKAKVDKAFIAIALVLLPLVIMFFLGYGEFVM
jgi:hypothetical protein